MIDSVPSRLELAKEAKGDVKTINFKETPKVVEEVYKLVPGGLDIAIDCGTFHEPKVGPNVRWKVLIEDFASQD